MKSTNYPSLNYVSAKHILSPCPSYLFKALVHSKPDRQVWLDSYDEGIQGLIDHEVYENISKIQCLALKRAGKILKAIPSLCLLSVKNYKDAKPLRAKSCIVVLGKFEDGLYQKSHIYALVLKYSSLFLLTAKSVDNKLILQKGYFNNAFCNTNIPDDEFTVI